MAQCHPSRASVANTWLSSDVGVKASLDTLSPGFVAWTHGAVVHAMIWAASVAHGHRSHGGAARLYTSVA